MKADLAGSAVHRAWALLAGFPGRETPAELDWGIPLLARQALTIELGTPDADAEAARQMARASVLAWAAGYRGRMTQPALFGWGLAGYAVGLAHAATVEPRLARLAGSVRDQVVARCPKHQAGQAALAFADYDLIRGRAGVVLGLASLPGCQPEHIEPGLRYLIGRCDGPALPVLRVTADGGDPQNGWSVGRLNHGLAHGVPGVLAALVTAWPLTRPALRDQVATAIGHLARYLVRASAVDSRGVLTWLPASGLTPSSLMPRRQAWCYGAPGVAWPLAEAGRILNDPDARACAAASITSLSQAWDDDYYLAAGPATSRLGFCHGAAGILAVARAFSHHCGLAGAGRLAEHLSQLLQRETGEADILAGTDITLLSGVTGVLAVQLAPAVRIGDWQIALGLGPSG